MKRIAIISALALVLSALAAYIIARSRRRASIALWSESDGMVERQVVVGWNAPAFRTQRLP